MSEIRKAVSLIFTHGKEIYSIVRKNHLRAFPGYTSFPGGKLEKHDEQNDLEKTLHHALVREAKEELQIDIDHLVNSKTIKNISKVGIATSPDFNPRRFEVHFYRIQLEKKVKFILDENEVASGKWLDSSSILQEYNFGKRLMILPIKKMIERLGEDINFSECIDFDDIERGKIPSIEPIRNIIQFMPQSNTLLPATRTNAFVIGGQQKLLVDPSPRDLEEYRHLTEALQKFQFVGLMITHHHKDHHEYAPQLARYFSIPILISKDSYQRCLTKYGEDYFEDITVKTIQEGDEVITWLNKPVRVVEVPGHDEGQLALMPENKNWCLVGDLFQGVGTVVVGGDEGDMTKYMNSLKRIINEDPMCVIPSHGIALGGTHILQKTLEHREMREEQVLDLYSKGKTIDEILKVIYFDLSRKLLPYAKANIEKHLEKLKKDGAL